MYLKSLNEFCKWMNICEIVNSQNHYWKWVRGIIKAKAGQIDGNCKSPLHSTINAR